MPCASDQLPHKQLTTKTRVFVCDRANAGSYDNILSSSFDNRQNDRLVYCKTYIEVNKVTHLPLTDSLLPNDLRNVISLFEEAVSGSYKQGDLWILLNKINSVFIWPSEPVSQSRLSYLRDFKSMTYMPRCVLGPCTPLNETQTFSLN